MRSVDPTSTPACDGLTVMFDGGCPLCRREIGLYQSLPSSQPVQWQDVSGVQTSLSAAEQVRYLKRFHVRLGNGQVLSGAAAFAALWSVLPGWRWLARVAAWPAVMPVLEALYTGFLQLRPRLQSLARAAEISHLPKDMVGDLRTDHAGETGAVAVYRGMLWASRDPQVRDFAERHLATERQHLETMNAILPPLRRSKLIALWRWAGFVTGAVPAVIGPPAVYATVTAIESFVHSHYQEQITQLKGRADHRQLLAMLEGCCQDELEHLEDARNRLLSPPGLFTRWWCRAIGAGSVIGVWLAKRV